MKAKTTVKRVPTDLIPAIDRMIDAYKTGKLQEMEKFDPEQLVKIGLEHRPVQISSQQVAA